MLEYIGGHGQSHWTTDNVTAHPDAKPALCVPRSTPPMRSRKNPKPCVETPFLKCGEVALPVVPPTCKGDVSSFPVELLSEVFSYLIWTRPLESDLVVTTHICRRWRMVALCAPSLWTHVSATNILKTQTFIERSKEILVDVHVCGSRDVKGMMDLLQRYATRIRSLRVNTGQCPMTMYCLTRLSRIHAPMLETLRLDGPEINAIVPYLAQSTISHLPPLPVYKVEGPSSMPRLRNLYLCPFAFSWNATIYQNLSVLDLRAPGLHPLTMQRLLNILHQCPDLQSFMLQTSMILPSSVEPTDDEWMVHLPRLETFHLDGPALPQMVILFEHLALPPTARSVLTTQAVPPMPTRDQALPGSRHHLPGLSSFRAVEFKQLNLDVVRLTCTRDSADGPVLTLSFRVAHIVEALTSITSFVDVRAVETLSISLLKSTEVTLVDWSAALRELRRIRTLRLAGLTNNTLRCALSALRTPLVVTPEHGPEDDEEEHAQGVTQMPCAELTEVELDNVEVPCRVSTDVLWLCDERRRAGCALKRIRSECGVFSDRCVSEVRACEVEMVV